MGPNKTALIYRGHATQLVLTYIESGRRREKGYEQCVQRAQLNKTIVNELLGFAYR